MEAQGVFWVLIICWTITGCYAFFTWLLNKSVSYFDLSCTNVSVVLQPVSCYCWLRIYLPDPVLPHLPVDILSEFPVLTQLIGVGVCTACHLSDCPGCLLALGVHASRVCLARSWLPACFPSASRLPSQQTTKQVKSTLTSAVRLPGAMRWVFSTTGAAANPELHQADRII